MKILLLIVALFSGIASAADADTAHEHQGLIKAYTGAPPAISLTRPELMKLRKGEPVLKQQHDGDAGGRGVAVFRVNADREKVMRVIMDYPNYVNWVNKLSAADTYAEAGEKVFVRFLTKAVGIKVEWFIEHTVNWPEYWVTWTLDYSRNSDLDDSVGYWLLKEVAGQPGVTQVEYSVDIRLKGWVPRFVKKIMVNRGLEDATSWVKVQSESR
jgi:hypothetical protein